MKQVPGLSSRSSLLRGFDKPLAPIGAGLLEGLGEHLPRGREDLDERVPVASQAPELRRVAEVEPDPERVAVIPPDPLDLRLELLPGGHRTSILMAWGGPAMGGHAVRTRDIEEVLLRGVNKGGHSDEVNRRRSRSEHPCTRRTHG
jgi:hypothetical protein